MSVLIGVFDASLDAKREHLEYFKQLRVDTELIAHKNWPQLTSQWHWNPILLNFRHEGFG